MSKSGIAYQRCGVIVDDPSFHGIQTPEEVAKRAIKSYEEECQLNDTYASSTKQDLITEAFVRAAQDLMKSKAQKAGQSILPILRQPAAGQIDPDKAWEAWMTLTGGQYIRFSEASYDMLVEWKDRASENLDKQVEAYENLKESLDAILPTMRKRRCLAGQALQLLGFYSLKST